MSEHDRPNLKQIRIKQSVCARLDERKSKDDSYTDVIKALLDENERLTARCEELNGDKHDLMAIAFATRQEAQKRIEIDKSREKLIDGFFERQEQRKKQEQDNTNE